MVSRTVARAVVVDDVSERVQARPGHVLHSVNDHEGQGSGEDGEPKEEVIQ